MAGIRISKKTLEILNTIKTNCNLHNLDEAINLLYKELTKKNDEIIEMKKRYYEVYCREFKEKVNKVVAKGLPKPNSIEELIYAEKVILGDKK